MKLCVVTPFPPELSGLGIYGWNVAHGLAQTGRFESLTVLAEDSRSVAAPSPLETCNLRTLYAWTRDDPATALRLVHIIQVERPDVVWFNLGFSIFGSSRATNFLGLTAPMLTQLSGIPAVVTLHEVFEAAHLHDLGVTNGPVTGWGAQTATRLLLQADTVCVTLRSYVQILQTCYHAHNIEYVPLGTFAPPEYLPRPAGLPRNILINAMFAPYKGLPVLLEAFGRVRCVYPEASLTIAGGDHKRFPGYLASIRTATNGAAGIHWNGIQTESQLRDLFMQAYVVVVPSIATTGASSVVHRAAAFGRPLIVSDLPDLRAVTEEEDLRVDYVPPGDAGALAEALIQLLAEPERGEALAQHNLTRMQTMTVAHTCSRYLHLFDQAINRGRQRATAHHG